MALEPNDDDDDDDEAADAAEEASLAFAARMYEDSRKRDELAKYEFAEMCAVACASNRDFRLRRTDLEALLSAAERQGGTGEGMKWYANGDLPLDRPGLLAAVHPQLSRRETWGALYEDALSLARQFKRWVWLVQTESRWILVILAPDGDPNAQYPNNAGGEFQNDQFIGGFDPDGTWGVLGVS